MISLDKFNHFYIENKNKLHISKSNSHPIDNDKFSEWISRQGNEDSNEHIFADLLRKYTRYVPYTEFYDKIERISADINVLISTYKPTNVILLILGMNDQYVVQKSPVWMSLLYYGLLKDKITHIATNINDVISISNKNSDTKNLCIIPEDASYTGSQFRTFLNGDVNSPKNVEFVLGTPYISVRAKRRLKQILKRCYISSVTELFNSIKDNIDKEPSSVKEKAKRSNGYSDISNRYTIYFDHKLADSYSIIQDIYALGRDLSDDNRSTKILTLMKNCDYSKYDLDPTKRYSDIQKEIGYFNMCPTPIYKNIKYTYNQKEISSLFEII